MRRIIYTALALALAADVAWAQPVTPPAEAPSSQATSQPTTPDEVASQEKAKALFGQAEAQYRLGHFKDALKNYKEALKLWRHPSIIYNIAQCYRYIGDKKNALFFYKLFLADWERDKPGTKPPNEAEVQSHIKSLTLLIDADNERARLKALQEEEERRKAEEHKRKLALLEKQRKEPKLGQINIKGLDVSKAQVLIDSEPRGISPLVRPLEVKQGKHQVRIEAEGYLTWTREVEVKKGQQVEITVELQLRPQKSRLWLATMISSLVLAAGAEAVAWYFYTQANQHYEGTDPFKDDKNMVTLFHGLAGGMAAVSVTSLVLYLLSGRVEEQPAAPPASAGFLPLPGGGGAVGTIRF